MFTPKFTITNKILNNIAKIEAAREVVINAPLVPAWEAKFRQEALIRTVHHGNHVEGNPLNLAEVKDVLEGKKITARNRDIQEIINYRDVLKFIDGFNKRDPIDERTILYIHKLTTSKTISVDQCGHYRLTQVALKNQATGEITFMPPSAREVPRLMHDFIFWLNHATNDELSAILKAAIANYALNAIHPFIEGNGRTSRAIATLILYKEGYDIKRFFSLEEYYDRDATRYYDHLQRVSNQHQELAQRDLTPWLEYFSEGLAVELQRIKEKVQRLSVDLKLKGKVGQVALNERQIQLVEYMETNGKISNPDFRILFPMVSDDTMLRDLKDLIDKGIVRKKGKTKNAYYELVH
ncbi:MAG: Fic family protein [Patescibacteria group bacterium]|nr:Fic family protein [Patescibacteria group bacterium]